MTEGGRAAGRTGGPRLLVLLTALTALPALTASAQTVRARTIDSVLDAAPFNRQLWGVALVDDRGRLLYGRNADRLFIPASNTKLVVTTVASALMPPTWTVKTGLYNAGPIVDGVIQGDLVLYGRGDPTFSDRCYATDTTQVGVCDHDIFARFRGFADSLKARGISAIGGDLVGDGSYFEPNIVHGGWQNYDLNWWYAAPVTGLAFNDNSVDIHWGPGSQEGAPASITVTPMLGDLTLENRSRTRRGGGDNLDFFRDPGSMEIRAEGNVDITSRGGTEYFALPDPNLFAAQALRQALAEKGISVLGTTRSTVDSLEYQSLRQQPPLLQIESRPLRDWIFPVLNTSQNLFAELLLKQLGRLYGSGGSWAGGLEVERRFLVDSMGIDSTQFNVQDGSGLSSDNLVSPLAFTRMLRFIRNHPGWSTFAAGLPQSGRVGSLRNRFKSTPIEGRVWAKTGSISRVNTLSGFFETRAGRRYFFSVQANHHTLPGRTILAQIDSVVVAMARAVGEK
jgi:D-alanyl-D-alanine carboxypeptidase/D-alanyl-D-alanine-endopeptidase (penicillin-binding protein 4)